jgi:tetratricopeptide (TPR) repeat protein
MSRPPNIPKRNLPTAIKSSPQKHQVELLISQGLALHQQEKFEAAQVFYEQVLAVQENHFSALQLLGTLFAQTAQYAKALEFLNKSLQVNPHHAETYYNRGIVLHELMRLDEALSSYDKAIKIKPNYAEAHFNHGNVLEELMRLDEALASFDKAIAIKPDYADAYSNRGNILKKQSRLDEALASYDKAILYDNYLAESHSNRGVVLQELGHFDQALASYDAAISIRPDYANAFSNRGNVLQELQRLDDSLVSYDNAILINPYLADSYYNRGNALKRLQRLDEALGNYNQAISLKPDYAEAYYNRGVVFQEQCYLNEANTNYEKAINLKPDYAIAHWNLSLCNLLRANYQDGWQGYEWRWKCEEIPSFKHKRDFSEPLWLGAESLQDKTILLYAEQGLGDTIQFCRYVALVAELGAKIILEVQLPLVGLLKGLEGIDQLIAKGEPLPNFDFQCPLLSLPLAFKTELQSIPPMPKGISSDSEMTKKWQTILGKQEKLRVGLVWSGNAAHKYDHNRSLSLSMLLPNLPSNIEYVCLQKELRHIDQGLLAQHTEIKYFGDALEDFTDTVALCELMDVIISVDTSVAHLAATIGKPTWVLLPYSPDWRWLLDRDDNPWYPTAKLYRQEQLNHWGGVFEKIKGDLVKLIT